MSKNKTGSKHKKEEAAVVAEAISKSEEFLAKYKNHLIYTVAGVIILLGLGFGYMKLIVNQEETKPLPRCSPRSVISGQIRSPLP
jgi:hypothetical protein